MFRLELDFFRSCQKMRYKGRFKPSELACPETYEWSHLKDLTPTLDKQKYARFNKDLEARDKNEVNFTIQQLTAENNRL